MAARPRAGVHDKGSIELAHVIQAARERGDFHKAGAIALFIGIVRGQTPNHAEVEKLELQAYEEQANQRLQSICEDLLTREGIVDVQIHHLLGEFAVGEDLIYVLVAGAHRHHVFPVLEEAVERYKTEAPIFKKETTVDKNGKTRSFWVSEQGAAGK
jgi:molybdopterin synthase catalytic subunit